MTMLTAYILAAGVIACAVHLVIKKFWIAVVLSTAVCSVSMLYIAEPYMGGPDPRHFAIQRVIVLIALVVSVLVGLVVVSMRRAKAGNRTRD